MKVRPFFPVLLMIWPYLFFAVFLLPESASEVVIDTFLAGYLVMTLIVYLANIWNAFRYRGREAVRELAVWNLAIKLTHVPFFVFVFAVGVMAGAFAVIPAFSLFSILIIVSLIAIDFFLMLTSSIYGIRAALLMRRQGLLRKQAMIGFIVGHLIFVVDVICAILLRARAKNAM